MRDLFLEAHRVEADRGAFDVELAQELRHRGDLVALPVDEELAETQAAAVGPGADEVDTVLRVTVIETVAQGLAVDVHERACQIPADGGDVGDEAFDEAPRTQRGEDAPVGVVAGRAVGQLEEAAQPGLPEFGEAFEVIEALHASGHGGQGNEENFAEVVTLDLPFAGLC